jgi:glucose/arabinose dehydrogenase
MAPIFRTTALVAALLAAACGGSGDPAPTAPATAEQTGTPAATPAALTDVPAADAVEAVTVATGLRSPWGLVFLPDGHALVTEKAGTLRLVGPDGSVSAPIGGGPAVSSEGQGGLLDVTLSPTFATDRTIWFTFAEPAGTGLSRTAVGRAVLGRTSLEQVQVVFRQQPAMPGSLHYGARLRFAADGTLFVGLGERNERDRAQRLDNHLGKVVRIRTDGTAPPDNPFVGRTDALPEIWSYGHRNVQGATIDASTGALWLVEHGPRGGDEVNRPGPATNQGWPVVGYGLEYGTGAPVGEATTRADIAGPLHVWQPVSIAPSGMTFYTGDRIPQWRGDLLVGALAGRMLVRLDVQDGRVVGEQRLLTGLGERIRDVKVGPDGWPWLITDSPEGRLMRVQLR